MKPIKVLTSRGTEETITRYRLTPGGDFAAHRPEGAICIQVSHVPSGKLACTMSHLTFRTLRSVVERFALIERDAAEAVAALRTDADDPKALRAVRQAMRERIEPRGAGK